MFVLNLRTGRKGQEGLSTILGHERYAHDFHTTADGSGPRATGGGLVVFARPPAECVSDRLIMATPHAGHPI